MAYDVQKYFTWLTSKCAKGNNLQYSQDYRCAGYASGHYKEQGFYNPSGRESYDCSSLVGFALSAGGVGLIDLNYPPVVGYENSDLSDMFRLRGLLTALGYTKFPISAEKEAGDILISWGKHVETYYGDGMEVGAHNSTAGCSIRPYSGNQWFDCFYRLTDEPTPIPTPIPPTKDKKHMPIWMYPIFRWR